jgi:hypothetical protein
MAMVQLLNPRVLVASFVLSATAFGCAHPKPAPAPVVYRPVPQPLPPPPPPKKARLVVLPLDKLALPGTAEEINAKLAQVKLPGAEDATLATVSMETAQLQSECAEPTETCYLKIARLVDADRLLWAQVEKVAGKGKKKGKKTSTRVQIILFDREKLAVSGQADESFAGPITDEDLNKLVLTATGAAPGPAPSPGAGAPPAATPPPAAAPPPVVPATAQPAAAPAAGSPPSAARPAYAPQPAARQPVGPAPAPAGYPPPAAARPPAAYPPPAAAPSPAAYPPSAGAPPPAAYPPPAAAPPSYAPPAAAPPPASGPTPARWQ